MAARIIVQIAMLESDIMTIINSNLRNTNNNNR